MRSSNQHMHSCSEAQSSDIAGGYEKMVTMVQRRLVIGSSSTLVSRERVFLHLPRAILATPSAEAVVELVTAQDLPEKGESYPEDHPSNLVSSWLFRLVEGQHSHCVGVKEGLHSIDLPLDEVADGLFLLFGQKRERDREKREYERKRRRERHGKHRKDGLVIERFIPVSIFFLNLMML